MAVFSVQAQSYVKVTETPSDWSGDYLIVYEDGNVAFNGGLETLDVASNTIAVTIADNAIEATDVVNAAKFTINASGNILSASGYYIGQTSNANGLKSSTSKTYTNTLSLNADGSVNVVSGGAYLRYNAAKDQLRFRYYKTSSYSGQKAIALYKYTETTGGGGEGGETPDTPPVVEAPAAPTLPAACSFDNAMIVEITDVAEGATAYYSLNNENNWVVGTSVEITETTTVYAKVVKDELSSTVVNARYTKNVVIEGGIIDVLNIELTGITKGSTEYKSWNGKQVISSAVYAGQSAGDNDAIQLRSSSSNSGIVTTASGGNVKKIVVDWNSATASRRTLQVYGKNSAYSAPTELYATSGNTEQGELLGEIVCGTSTELVIEGDYEYIGLRSKSGAMYLNSVEVTWVEKPQPLGFTVALTVGEVGYATLYLGAAAQIPEGVSAYIVTDTSNGYAKMKEVTGIIPANTGVILVAEQGEYEFAFYDKGTADVTGNLLAGSLFKTNIYEEAYVLSAPDGVVGLYKAAMNQLDDTAWQNNANKAYLPASAVHNKAAAFYGFEWNGTTGIEGVEAEVAQDGAIYDLSGRRVKAITVPGIYIVNGKKVVK